MTMPLTCCTCLYRPAAQVHARMDVSCSKCSICAHQHTSSSSADERHLRKFSLLQNSAILRLCLPNRFGLLDPLPNAPAPPRFVCNCSAGLCAQVCLLSSQVVLGLLSPWGANESDGAGVARGIGGSRVAGAAAGLLLLRLKCTRNCSDSHATLALNAFDSCS